MIDEVSNDPSDEGFERLVPSVSLLIENAVAMNDPTEISRAWLAQRDRRRVRKRGEDGSDGAHRGDESVSIGFAQIRHELTDRTRRSRVEDAERLSPLLGQCQFLTTAVFC